MYTKDPNNKKQQNSVQSVKTTETKQKPVCQTKREDARASTVQLRRPTPHSPWSVLDILIMMGEFPKTINKQHQNPENIRKEYFPGKEGENYHDHGLRPENDAMREKKNENAKDNPEGASFTRNSQAEGVFALVIHAQTIHRLFEIGHDKRVVASIKQKHHKKKKRRLSNPKPSKSLTPISQQSIQVVALQAFPRLLVACFFSD